MNPHIALICNLEQIWPYNDASGDWVLVGINWSVSIGYDAPDDPDDPAYRQMLPAKLGSHTRGALGMER